MVAAFALASLDRAPPAPRGRARGGDAGRRGRLRVAAVALVSFGVVAVLDQDRGLPLALVILVGFVVVFDYIVRRTRFGRHVFAVGGNAEAARRAGIRVDRVRVIVFVLAELAGRLRRDPARVAPAGRQPVLGRQRPAAARDRRPGDRRHEPVRRARHGLVGAARRLVIGSISNGMDLLALPSSTKYMVTGGVLLAAVVVDAAARQRRQRAGRV